MRNLVVSKVDVQKFAKSSDVETTEDAHRSPLFISPDPDTSVVFLSDSNHIVKIDGENVETCSSFSEHIKDSEQDEVVAVEYLPDHQALFAISKTGTFILCDCNTHKVECVGSVSAGLQAMSWSPDLELAALVTSQPALLLITAEYEPVAELPLFSEEFGDMAPVTVGWGRKETQFHGSAGKAAAVTASQPAATETDPRDDGRPRVTWRGDGQMLAVSVLCPETGGRRFVVISRDGSRLSTSEPVVGLGHSLAWRPSGAVIAGVQRLPNKLQTVFFEKNGLRHGEFTLPFPPDQVNVRELVWSPDSAVLAIWLELESESRVQLWTTGNYHWYCKQEHVVDAPDRVSAVSWHPAADYRLLVTCRSGRLLTWEHQWRWPVGDRSPVAAVVDGRRLLVTPLADSVVPPPLSAHELQLPASVSAVCQGPAGAADWLWVATSDRCLHVFRLLPLGQQPAAAAADGCQVTVTAGGGVGFAVRAPLHEWRCSCTVGGAPPAAAAWGWELVSGDRLVCAAWTQDGYQLWVLDVAVPEAAGEGAVSATLSRTVPVLSAPVSVTAVGAGTSEAVIHTEDGRLLLLNTDSGELTPLTDTASGQDIKLPVPAEQVGVVCDGTGGKRRVLALTPQRRLYCDGRQLLAGSTSFSVADDFLLVTTLDHTLRCLPLSRLFSDGCTDSEELSWTEVAGRRLERGSRLVTAVRGDTRLVMQMPRGNLEVIHPRPLVVARLARLMDSGEYYTAYAEMRRHRINLNLLVDHAPDTFAARCDDICAALRHEPSWLCVFVSELSEEDVTRTLYSESYSSQPTCGTPAGKLDRVCELVRHSLERLDRGRLMLPLLTTLVRHSTPRLQETLRLISQLREEPPSDPDAVTADAALRYLICLVDVDQLYSVALGTYDFGLVMMVAEKSQKDPKEYLPLLNELRQLPTEYARYRVDCQLRRYESALRHLTAAGPERQPEVLRLVQEHALYGPALRLYRPGSAEYRAVCGLYADHLDAAGHSWEAAAMFVRAGAQTSAVDALRRAGAWRDCLQTAGQLGMPRDQLRELAAGLAAELRGAGRCADAAAIYERHLKQPEEQVACLLEGRLWAEAVYACHQARKPQMVAVMVVPALQRAADNTAETLRRITDTLPERRARLAVVRQQQLLNRRNQLADGDPAGVDSDLYSDSSSVSGVSGSSGSSSRTFRSSKSRRKQERRKYSLREGSGMEDLALIAACHGLITEADALTDDMSTLLRALVQHGLDESAAGLQRHFSSLLRSLPPAAAAVWPELTVQDATSAAVPQPAALGPTGTANQLIDLLQAGGDTTAAQTAQAARMAQLEPHLRFPPVLKKDAGWRLHCLEGFRSSETS